MRIQSLCTLLLILLILPAAVASQPESGAPLISNRSGFNVRPYIQNPEEHEVTLSWFSYGKQPGVIELAWFDRNGKERTRKIRSRPVLATELAYHPVELSAFPPPPTTQLPYHHQVRIKRLPEATQFAYRVRQSGELGGGTFRTWGAQNGAVRFIVYADSETEPESTGKAADWPGIDESTQGRVYLVDQTTGYRENLKIITSREPDFVAIAGDLVQSGGEQRDWDEFWRQNARLAASTPIFPALGNHDYFGGPGVLGRYETADSERAVSKYLRYFDLPGNGAKNHAHHERYYAKHLGPVSLVVLDLNNGSPHQSDRDPNWRLLGENDGGVAPEWQPGSEQYRWLEKTLAEAQKNSRFTFVMFHDCPYSSGVHGLPPGEGENQDILSGQPLRALTPLFMKSGVDVLLTGHDEMYEHSLVNGTEIILSGESVPHQLHVMDVGIGGDGLRGPIPGLANPDQVFMAHTDAPEKRAPDGSLQDGGKHYGHLEVNVGKDTSGRWQAQMDMVYVFPVTDSDGNVLRFERRIYQDSSLLTAR